ncbi:hypothetical protein RRG08_058274 [Elysia crispata]|uniref:Uncharacterized protein n=1 Tax=Elysia crispata TaxID=231223 RepID=A0AAE0YW16_9GAST|nr:hypothetical protein RRG08_058274 [Elysia crispata]
MTIRPSGSQQQEYLNVTMEYVSSTGSLDLALWGRASRHFLATETYLPTRLLTLLGQAGGSDARSGSHVRLW